MGLEPDREIRYFEYRCLIALQSEEFEFLSWIFHIRDSSS